MTEEEVLPPEVEERLRRGLAMLADETPAPGAAGASRTGARKGLSSRLPALALGAAAALAVVLAGPAVVDNLRGGSSSDGDTMSAQAPNPDIAQNFNSAATERNSAPGGTAADDAAALKTAPLAPGPEEGVGIMSDSAAGSAVAAPPAGEAAAPAAGDAYAASQPAMAYDLPRLVTESQRIVVGTVTAVDKGAASDASGGLDYVLATVKVADTLRGPAEAQVVAFDYAYAEDGTVNGAGGGPRGAAFAVGERVLVFLSDTAGTVHDGIAPKHWQVSGGWQGKYAMNGGEPVAAAGQAAFSLADVRAEVARQGG